MFASVRSGTLLTDSGNASRLSSPRNPAAVMACLRNGIRADDATFRYPGGGNVALRVFQFHESGNAQPFRPRTAPPHFTAAVQAASATTRPFGTILDLALWLCRVR